MNNAEHYNLGEALEQFAIIDGDVTLTYAELAVVVAEASTRLREHGIGPGERVGVMLPTDWRYLVLILALLHERAVACFLNLALPPTALAAQLEQVNSTKLIATSDHDLPNITLLDPSSLIVHPSSFHRSNVPTLQPSTFDQPATIIFTSGSVGRPKAVLHTWGNHYFNALGSGANIPYGSGDRWLLSLPLFHVSGLSAWVRTIVGGATVVIPQQRHELAATITEHGITHVSLVSTQLIRLFASDDGRQALQQLKAILLGGSAMSRAVLNEAYALDLPIHTSYGLTEMGAQVATTPRDVPIEKRYTSGRVLPYRELRIDAGGQIWVRGRTRFAGYVEGSDLRKPFDAGGWYATGDVGWLDDDGYLHVQGRKDNMFISGGENIQPEEIEAALLQLQGIEQAMVVPVPDAEWGMRPMAFVKAQNVSEEQIITFLQQRLPRFKIPRTFLPWPAHLAATGIKVSRKQMQQLGLHLVGTDGTNSTPTASE